jgi:hypothetical protein
MAWADENGAGSEILCQIVMMNVSYEALPKCDSTTTAQINIIMFYSMPFHYQA